MQTQLGTQVMPELREQFSSAKKVLVLTGAGVSTESGVPTFRGGGNSAVWKGMPFDVISSAHKLLGNQTSSDEGSIRTKARTPVDRRHQDRELVDLLVRNWICSLGMSAY